MLFEGHAIRSKVRRNAIRLKTSPSIPGYSRVRLMGVVRSGFGGWREGGEGGEGGGWWVGGIGWFGGS